MPAQFAQLLADGDVAALRRAWRQVAPHLPQPATDAEAEIVMHHARTQARSVPMRRRAWSHRWLLERGYPSGLPDILRVRAERLYPRIVEAVGISVNAHSSLLAPIVAPVRRAMEHAVLEVYADHGPHPDPNVVRARMQEARAHEVKKLLGV